MTKKYKLAAGTQVREEDFGLLFYTRKGPRLYFLPSGKLLNHVFFKGDMTLTQWLQNDTASSVDRGCSLKASLSNLVEKGVIIEF